MTVNRCTWNGKKVEDVEEKEDETDSKRRHVNRRENRVESKESKFIEIDFFYVFVCIEYRSVSFT